METVGQPLPLFRFSTPLFLSLHDKESRERGEGDPGVYRRRYISGPPILHFFYFNMSLLRLRIYKRETFRHPSRRTSPPGRIQFHFLLKKSFELWR